MHAHEIAIDFDLQFITLAKNDFLLSRFCIESDYCGTDFCNTYLVQMMM